MYYIIINYDDYLYCNTCLDDDNLNSMGDLTNFINTINLAIDK